LARNAEKCHKVVKEGHIKESDCPPNVCLDPAMNLDLIHERDNLLLFSFKSLEKNI
jgi:hypothetical protein